MATTQIARRHSRVRASSGARRQGGFDPRWLHPFALIAIYTTWSAKRRSRRALVRLSDEHLADIGVTRDQAMREAERILWRGDWYE